MLFFQFFRHVSIMDSSISWIMAFRKSWMKKCSGRVITCSLLLLMRRWCWLAVLFEVTHLYTTRNTNRPRPPKVLISAHENCLISLMKQRTRWWFKLLFESGDSKEMFTFGPSEGVLDKHYPNKWSSQGKHFLHNLEFFLCLSWLSLLLIL